MQETFFGFHQLSFFPNGNSMIPSAGLTSTQDQAVKLMKGVATAVLAALIRATLYLGRDVFVPLSLSVLLSFVLAPLVRALQNWHVPRAFSVIGVVLLAFLIIFSIGSVIATQMAQ